MRIKAIYLLHFICISELYTGFILYTYQSYILATFYMDVRAIYFNFRCKQSAVAVAPSYLTPGEAHPAKKKTTGLAKSSP